MDGIEDFSLARRFDAFDGRNEGFAIELPAIGTERICQTG